jgi:hypothetical protein
VGLCDLLFTYYDVFAFNLFALILGVVRCLAACLRICFTGRSNDTNGMG